MCKTCQNKDLFDLKPFKLRFFEQGFNTINGNLKI